MKTRFAPSPTGFIHLGNARTALFSGLFAKAQKGEFLLRIEDTDQARSTEEFLSGLVEDLHWLNIIWQEGEGVGGQHGPYRQSARDSIYANYYQKLIDLDRAYPCYCTDEELDLERALQKKLGQPPRYSGKCAYKTREEQIVKETEGIRPSLRFRIKKGEWIEFTDGVKGKQVYRSEDIGDFIIRRQNGSPTFLFCNAIDDSTMGVTDVLRGEDHLTNTPRQLMILKALKMREPEQYAHMALINGADGAPLSKRNGSRSIRELRMAGFLSIAVLNYMARLGHYYEENHLMSYDELAAQFSLKSLGTKAARFDEDQLLYWQRVAIHQLDDHAFWVWANEGLQNEIEVSSRLSFIHAIRENVLFPKDVTRYAEIFFSKNFLPDWHGDVLQGAGAAFFDLAVQVIEEKGLDYQALIGVLMEQLGLRGKALFMPLRVALTGELHGPKLESILGLLGANEAKRRLTLAKGLL